ncbi:Uncharacterized protein Rs2_28404 [Raphanus sativus]|nr:Uncharacterized protein Rs2_28404 [Raphanus sativus]
MLHRQRDCTVTTIEETKQNRSATYKRKEDLVEQTNVYRSERSLRADRYYKQVVNSPYEVKDKEPTEGNQPDNFQERFDRHGNSFGTRVTTKQTRVPPPLKLAEEARSDALTWKNKTVSDVERGTINISPPYTQRRNPGGNRETQGRSLFPQRGPMEWRRKLTLGTSLASLQTAQPPLIPHPPGSPRTTRQENQSTSRNQAEAQIMDSLNEATMRYLNYPDPTEAAARRQRVMAGDARGQTEDRVASLLNGLGFPTEKTIETPSELHISSNLQRAQIMQELQETTQQYLSCADPVEAAARRQRVLDGDAAGLMERTADSILAASSLRRPLSPWELGIKSVSPPGIDFETAMQPSDAEVTPPPERRHLEEHIAINLSLERQERNPEKINIPAKLKSIVRFLDLRQD